MKILVSAYDCSPHRGSEAAIGWNWCLGLARSGEEVWVITQTANRHAIEQYTSAIAVRNLHFVYVEAASVPDAIARHVFGFWYGIYLNWQSRIVNVAQELDRVVDFDVVHHVSWGSLQLGSKLWRLNKPFFYGPVGGGQTAPYAFKAYFGANWRVELLRNFVVHRMSGVAFGAGNAVRRASTVFVTNRDTEKLVRKMGAEKVEFLWDSAVPEGWLLDPCLLPELRPGPLRLIWVGTLMPRKGVRLALEVMDAIRDKTDVSLTIVGDGPDRAAVQREVIERGLERSVILTGRLPWQQVKAQYDEHHIMLFTSLRESLGMQMFEGMARGCPVICLDLHGAANLITDACGIKVPAVSPKQTVEDFSAAILRLDVDRVKLGELRVGALRKAASLTWISNVSQAQEAYRCARLQTH